MVQVATKAAEAIAKLAVHSAAARARLAAGPLVGLESTVERALLNPVQGELVDQGAVAALAPLAVSGQEAAAGAAAAALAALCSFNFDGKVAYLTELVAAAQAGRMRVGKRLGGKGTGGGVARLCLDSRSCGSSPRTAGQQPGHAIAAAAPSQSSASVCFCAYRSELMHCMRAACMRIVPAGAALPGHSPRRHGSQQTNALHVPLQALPHLDTLLGGMECGSDEVAVLLDQLEAPLLEALRSPAPAVRLDGLSLLGTLCERRPGAVVSLPSWPAGSGWAQWRGEDGQVGAGCVRQRLNLGRDYLGGWMGSGWACSRCAFGSQVRKGDSFSPPDRGCPCRSCQQSCYTLCRLPC